MRGDLYVVGREPGVDPGDRVLLGAGKGWLQTDGGHPQVGDVLHVLAEDVLVQADHGAALEQVLGPLFLLNGRLFEQLEAGLFALGGDLGHLRVVLTAAHQVQHVLGTGQVQCLIAGDHLDDLGVALHQLALGEGKGAGEADVEADRFQRVDAHQAEIELLLELAQGDGHLAASNGVGSFTVQVVEGGRFDQVVVEVADGASAFEDLLVGHDVVEHLGGSVDDVADDMGVGARVDGLGEGPGLDPGFQLRNGDQRQQRHVGAAPLNGVQQGLVLQVGDEDVLLVGRQGLIVDAITGDIHLFRAPEEGELFFDQPLEHFVLLLVITGYVDRLAKKHRLFELVVLGLAES